ncbi:MAG: hypothetical protein Q7R47_02740, partial [Candidatus Diapherotrites archaeon]|nr:hypothetical protein [Candidatus Diapherotrites archaeon]
MDHGKCIALEEPILLNHMLRSGTELLSEISKQVSPSIISESERLFAMPHLNAFALDPSFRVVSVPSNLFVQNYEGPMIEIVTNDGKRLKASPEHPLLVNDGLEIRWIKAKDLTENQFVGALKQIPETEVLKDPFPNWIAQLEKTCWVVSAEHATELSQKTRKFSAFDYLSVSELNEIRILKRISLARLEKACSVSQGALSRGFKTGKLAAVHRTKILRVFESDKQPVEMPKGMILNLKSKSKSFAEIQDPL